MLADQAAGAAANDSSLAIASAISSRPTYDQAIGRFHGRKGRRGRARPPCSRDDPSLPRPEAS